MFAQREPTPIERVRRNLLASVSCVEHQWAILPGWMHGIPFRDEHDIGRPTFQNTLQHVKGEVQLTTSEARNHASAGLDPRERRRPCRAPTTRHCERRALGWIDAMVSSDPDHTRSIRIRTPPCITHQTEGVHDAEGTTAPKQMHGHAGGWCLSGAVQEIRTERGMWRWARRCERRMGIVGG